MINPWKSVKLYYVITYLYQEAFHELFVGCLVILHLLSDFFFHCSLEIFNEFVDLSHSIDSLSVLLFGLFNLNSHSLIGQLVLEVFLDLLFFFSEVSVSNLGELIFTRFFNSISFFLSVSLNELNHWCENLIGVLVVLHI